MNQSTGSSTAQLTDPNPPTSTTGQGSPARMDRLVPFLLLVAAGSLIGLRTDLAKVAADQDLTPFAFLTWSVVGAALVLGAVGAKRHRLPSISVRTLEYFVVAAVVSLVAPQLIFFSAAPKIGAGFAALALVFSPLYTYAGALVMHMERFDPWRALGVGLALAASVLLAALKLGQPDAPAVWIIVTLTAPILLAVGNLYRTRRWPPGSSADQLAPGMVAAAAIILLVTSLLPGPSLAIPTNSLTPLLMIAAQTATFSGLYLLYFILQQRGGPVILSLLGSVAAVVGTAIAMTVLNEPAPPGLVPAGILIALGIGLVTQRADRA